MVVECELMFVTPTTELFAAPSPIEKVSTLKVLNYGPGTPNVFPDRVRFADLLVPGCKAGDVLDVAFQYQITNNLAYDVENAWRLILTQDATGIEGIRAPGRGYNITPGMHHGPGADQWRVVLPYAGDWYVAAVVYAGGGSLSHAGDTVPVDGGYGSLTVTRFRNS